MFLADPWRSPYVYYDPYSMRLPSGMFSSDPIISYYPSTSAYYPYSAPYYWDYPYQVLGAPKRVHPVSEVPPHHLCKCPRCTAVFAGEATEKHRSSKKHHNEEVSQHATPLPPTRGISAPPPPTHLQLPDVIINEFMDVPETRYIDEIVEVPQRITVEKVIPKLVPQIHERDVYVPKPVVENRMIDTPQHQRRVHVINEVPKINYEKRRHQVPKPVYDYVAKVVEVPGQIHVVDKVVEVPQVVGYQDHHVGPLIYEDVYQTKKSSSPFATPLEIPPQRSPSTRTIDHPSVSRQVSEADPKAAA